MDVYFPKIEKKKYINSSKLEEINDSLQLYVKKGNTSFKIKKYLSNEKDRFT